MKRLFILLLLVAVPFLSFTQNFSIYSTSNLEMLFSFCNLNAYDDVENFSSRKGEVIRFAPVFNIQESINFDFGRNFGLYTGVSLRNVGFIYKLKDPSKVDATYSSTSIKKKFRTYNIGIPVGFKVGNFDKFFFYGGYEIECPLHYKEKSLIGNDKSVYKEWFSDKTPYFLHSVYGGIEFPYSINLKFNWYLTNFFDYDCNEYIKDMPDIKYKDFYAHIFYFSLSCSIFENAHFYFKKYMESADGYYY